MRWKTPEKLKPGAVSYRRYFALWPTALDDGNTVWLERYWAKEVWVVDAYGMSDWLVKYTSANHPEKPEKENVNSKEWKPRSKYEAAPGLFIGSEIGDIDREMKTHIRRLLDGDKEAIKDINRLSDRRIELMTPKRLRNDYSR